jgi:hypothetical protein
VLFRIALTSGSPTSLQTFRTSGGDVLKCDFNIRENIPSTAAQSQGNFVDDHQLHGWIEQWVRL